MGRILVVDDDASVLQATTLMLTSLGFEVVAVGDGGAGVAAVKSAAFDAAIVDLFMPKMDGLETARAIHQHNPQLPIIAVSGFMFSGPGRCPDMPNFHAMATEAGAVAAVYKPFRPSELRRVINDVIRARAGGPAAAQAGRMQHSK